MRRRAQHTAFYVAIGLFVSVLASTPRPEAYFPLQLVNHNQDDEPHFWKQRFYTMGEHFQGPGSPIFLILGGEGAIEPSTGILYPFIADNLAVSFGAYILQPEHRFYGKSQPISIADIERARELGRVDPRLELLSPDQALQDAIRLLRFVRDRLGCSRDRFSKSYCPVIAVGGSYPGFLSAMARTVYPYVVDMAYSASAPMKFYAQTMETGDEYYHHITEQTDKAFAGCAAAVESTLSHAVQKLRELQIFNASVIGACPETLPAYINNTQTMIDETIMMVGYTFANMNMGYYPPSNATQLGRACEVFSDKEAFDPLDRLQRFLVYALAASGETCFNMNEQLPTGKHATISAGDWSGVGTGTSGESWDFQTCTRCVEKINMAGFLPRRNWTMEWLESHCQRRFGVQPTPYELVHDWQFDDLVAAGASRILFTNGLVDGWSVAGIQSNLSDTLVAINFEHGAHHSDLSYYKGMHDDATEDIKLGRGRVRSILSEWLEDLPGGRMSNA
jgi:hypothetical protein